MNKLLLNGSYREGFTKQLINYLCAREQFEIIDVHTLQIASCTNCGYCKRHCNKCIIQDDMQKIYKLIEEADILVYATPIYTASVTPALLSVMSRFQKYFEVKHHFQREYPFKEKKGFVLVSGGSPLSMYYENVLRICQTSFLETNTKYCQHTFFKSTDTKNELDKDVKKSLEKIVAEIRSEKRC